ncbi:MAG TPA: hypothetical protein VFA21_12160 [Pyrinomonadaceae bacterium]|nr:hypothetical protein [Pyrinomonadaceae bacterium]
MNCQDFDTVAGELADARLMDAATRDAGLGHAATCVECAARLMHERGVSATLRVAASAETEEASARVKHSLLAAFAEQQKTATAPATVVEISSRRKPRWRVALAAAAAVVLLSLALPSLLRLSPDSSQVPPPDMSAGVQFPAVPTPTGEAISPSATPKVIAPHDGAKRDNPRGRKHANAPRGTASSKYETVAQNANNEYLPLTYLDPSTALESGTVVRVRLSRSALMSLGVPVSAERSDDLVKAEVVLGDDGVARAIRLVR